MSSGLPKFPFVSLYAMHGRHRITYKLGGRRVTERLGVDPKKAAKRARAVSDVLDNLKCRLIKLDDAMRLLSDNRHVSIHLQAFRQHLTSRGGKPKYVAGTIQHVQDMLDLMHASKLDHLTLPGFERAMIELRGKKKLDGRGQPTDQPLSALTIAHKQKAMRSFTRWLTKKAKLLALDPLEAVDHVKVKGTGKTRRVPTQEEWAVLIDWLWDQPKRKHNGKPGVERAMLYLMAYNTGLRAGEIRPIRVDWIRLDPTPQIHVPGEFTKNGKAAVQPLPRWFAEALLAWVGPRTGLLFDGLRQDALSKLLVRDMADARADWIAAADQDPAEQARRQKSDFLKKTTLAGTLDFHALRHAYVSRLVDQGVTAKEAQDLARHSTPLLTIGRYSHADERKFASKVEGAMPNLATERMRVALRLSGAVSTTNDDKRGQTAGETDTQNA